MKWAYMFYAALLINPQSTVANATAFYLCDKQFRLCYVNFCVEIFREQRMFLLSKIGGTIDGFWISNRICCTLIRFLHFTDSDTDTDTGRQRQKQRHIQRHRHRQRHRHIHRQRHTSPFLLSMVRSDLWALLHITCQHRKTIIIFYFLERGTCAYGITKLFAVYKTLTYTVNVNETCLCFKDFGDHCPMPYF
jgi:hypothetical protein